MTAHELRTPISVLSGSADTLVHALGGDSTDEERADLLDAMTSSAERLRRLLARPAHRLAA